MVVGQVSSSAGADFRIASAGPRVALAETCRVIESAIPLWRLHRARLAVGGCSIGLLSEVERAVGVAIGAYEGERTSRLRLHLEVGADGSLTVELSRALSSLDVVGGPLLAAVQAADLPPIPSLPTGAAKPADRSWWDCAAREARRQRAHQALILDSDGFVIDGSSASVWIVRDGRLLTPPSPPAIAGVARRLVLDHAGDLDLEAAAAPVNLVDVEGAEEVFLTNAFGGAVAVRGRNGPVAEAVRGLFARILVGVPAFGSSE